MDYIKLIERLNSYDTDQDYMLDLEQFGNLSKDLKITENSDLVSILYRSVAGKNGISFNNIRLIYEASMRGLKNHTMLTLMFCGIDHDTDKKLQYDEFYRLAKIIDEESTDDDITSRYNKLDSDKVGYVTYQQVASELFGIRVRDKENPFKAKFYYRSPELECCLLL